MDINKLRSLALDGDLAAMQAIIIHLERVEKERDDLRGRLALESQENGALRDSVDRACEERDALRAAIELRIAEEKESMRRAMLEFEARVASVIETGAADRATALDC